MLVLLLCGPALRSAEPPCPIQLSDVTRQTGISFVHTDGSFGRKYIVETVCCGMALLDYDGDGDVDIYFLNGAALPGTGVTTPPRNVLDRNDGGWRFTDVTRAAGVVNGDKVGAGACFLDIDKDGDLDLYVANYVDFTCGRHQTRYVNGHPAYVGPMIYGPVPDTLFRHNGDGTFTDIRRKSGVAPHTGTGMGMA